jgi:hypothetical protein
MIRRAALNFRWAPAMVVIATAWLATSAKGSIIYNFETLDNNGDPNFNQLLSMNSTAFPTITGYFGDGMIVDNKGYTLVQPFNSQASYTNENFPGSVQTQVTGITPNGALTTVGFYIDNNGNNIGFVDQSGVFTSVSDPSTPAITPSVNQLLGVNDLGVAAGFYVDSMGNAHGYTYSIGSKSFTPINLPGSFNAVSTTVSGINDAGVITGFYTDMGGVTHGFVDNGGTFKSFDDPNGNGTNTTFLGINSSDLVVGSYVDMAGNTDGLLFNYLTDSFQTLDDPLQSTTTAFGVNGTTINGINNAGDVVGFYSDGTHVNGFLATPTPEPAMTGLLLAGVALMIGRYWHRKRAHG